MTTKELNKLMHDDLKRSGLTVNDVKKMKCKALNEEQAETILNNVFVTDGYVIPYFDINGKETNNFRFRFTKELLDKDGKIVKYSQVKGSNISLYFPPCIKWKAIAKDIKKPIVFTEGEKKAFKASKLGINTIGLGGVWSFKSKKQGKKLLDDFRDIDFNGRAVYICFDNDAQTNPEVMKAMRAFAKELYSLGAKVHAKELPFDPYEKIGIDDYLLNHAPKDFWKLPEVEFVELQELESMNDHVAYIKDLGKFIIIDSDLICSSATLKNDVYPYVTMLDGEGKKIPVINEWIKWEGRRTHAKITYAPAKGKVTENNYYNAWKGWATTPKKGDVSVFLKAVNQIFDNNKEVVQWFLDWCAYPIQYPSTKMLSAVMLQSVKQGTGKSSIGMCIGAVYGDNYQLIDDDQLYGNFNEWAVNKQFILGDEISAKDRRTEADKIKNLVTRPEITINKKYAPTYTVPDCINYFFTSNHPDPLSIEPDDRRFFVYNVQNGLTLQQGEQLEFFHKKGSAGIAYLFHYFAYEHKISKSFSPKSAPPMTEAKIELIENSLSDVERFLKHLRDSPDAIIDRHEAYKPFDLFTTEQITRLYQKTAVNSRPVSSTAVGKALKKIFAGNDITKIAYTDSGSKRLRAVRNIDKWKHKSSGEWGKHLQGRKAQPSQRRKRLS